MGTTSLFCSFSSAETKWIHLLKILGKLIDHKDYSDEELDNLTWEEKCRLIQSDPVTCARHFDHQFNTFLKAFLISDIGPLGKNKGLVLQSRVSTGRLISHTHADMAGKCSSIWC